MEKKSTQSDKFREAARELETDDDEARFDSALKKVAKSKLTEDSGSDSMNSDDVAG